MSRTPEDIEPDLAIGDLKVWVHGRQFPDAQDFWDGNWLNVTARCATYGASVEAAGTFLRNTDLAQFLDGCRQLYETLEGEAVLEPLEPNLRVRLRGSRTGHIEVQISITPEHMTQRHEFGGGIDQTFLQGIMRGAEQILQRYPVRGDPSLGI